MKLELILSDDRKIICDFAGDMQAAYDQYSAKPFLLDGVEAIVCRLHYIPDPIDFQAKNVTACFTTDLGMSTIICDKFAMHLAPYCQDQTGHEIVCDMVNGQRITHSWLYKPDVLLIMGSVAIPSSVIHKDMRGSGSDLLMRRSRYSSHDPRNLQLICDWCKEQGLPCQFI